MLKESTVGSAVKNEPAMARNRPPHAVDTVASASIDAMFEGGFLADVHKERPNEALGQEAICTRFPPEPNGYLHLGHSKAIAINFGFARYHGGQCILRFDDTNPMGEEAIYYKAIEDVIAWLGYKPSRITYSSDNFNKLYELAEELIKVDGAYVCHCSDEQIKAHRGLIDGKWGGKRTPCEHRSRPIEDSLKEFKAMRDGKYPYQTAVLRMKQDLENSNPQMWDLAAYRIPKEFKPHHRTGNYWKIYPTYDFAHCLCDSIEKVTHSLCTTEFELSRTSYEWLCDKVKLYKPMQREYGRLSLDGVMLSKRKIAKLVEQGIVRDWNDPRLYTLIALRRRGIPPGAILAFVNELGVTKTNSSLQIPRFEQCVRKYLEITVPRLLIVLDPIPIIINNLPNDYEEMVEMPYSKDPAFGSRPVPFTRTVYIDRSDFREQDSKDFYRLAPGKSVGLLKVPFPITATSFEKHPETGVVTLIHAEYTQPSADGKFKKPKTYIHWVGQSREHNSPVKATVRLHNPIFNLADPDAHPDGFLAAINPNSEEVFPNAMIDIGFHEVLQKAPWPAEAEEQSFAAGETVGPETVRFQGMRTAYFCVDEDSTADNIILNRIVSLKEDNAKKA